MNERNIILTGTPRSGTTLVCHLLNKLPDVIALHEPIGPKRFEHLLPEHDDVAGGVQRLFNRQLRPLALDEGLMQTKHVNGEVPDNPFSSTAGGERQRKVGKGNVPHGKNLSEDFTLVIKDPPLFGAILGALAKKFPHRYAIIRNPLATLGSWNSLDMPSREGRFPTAEKYDPSLPGKLEHLDRYDRQVYMLSWWYERFASYIQPEHIIRYETLISSGGRELSKIHPGASKLNEVLESKNQNSLYDTGELHHIADRLLASESVWRFYSPSEVEALL